jgi:hypothetical protein
MGMAQDDGMRVMADRRARGEAARVVHASGDLGALVRGGALYGDVRPYDFPAIAIVSAPCA